MVNSILKAGPSDVTKASRKLLQRNIRCDERSAFGRKGARGGYGGRPPHPLRHPGLVPGSTPRRGERLEARPHACGPWTPEQVRGDGSFQEPERRVQSPHSKTAASRGTAVRSIP